MTFRSRLVLTATAAVLVVVVLGSLATYLVAYNSLVGSVDVTLNAEAQSFINSETVQSIYNVCGATAGQCIQLVLPVGTVNEPDGSAVLPITPPVRAVASSQGEATNLYFSTMVGNLDVREVVAALPPDYQYR
ncbi:MAG TPA: hypothetical protein VHW93_01765, partial [Acidimicrobiales bacterium]|nr:hypothetical protein [Acidimicrobiales bacterium]